MTPQQTMQNIRDVMTKAIRAGLSDQQNYPGIRNVGQQAQEIYIDGSPDLSISLRDVPYNDVYAALDEARAYNLRLIDGSLVQMVYSFRRNKIHSHRLALFPSPHLDAYEDASESYERDEIFAEITGGYLVRFPIRFDFSALDEEHIEIDHPKSHVTLGQYKKCRIPVNAPLSPSKFMRFVIRSFYFPALSNVELSDPKNDPSFPDTITDRERAIAFFST